MSAKSEAYDPPLNVRLAQLIGNFVNYVRTDMTKDKEALSPWDEYNAETCMNLTSSQLEILIHYSEWLYRRFPSDQDDEDVKQSFLTFFYSPDAEHSSYLRMIRAEEE
jgi:hypothetical protein